MVGLENELMEQLKGLGISSEPAPLEKLPKDVKPLSMDGYYALDIGRIRVVFARAGKEGDSYIPRRIIPAP